MAYNKTLFVALQAAQISKYNAPHYSKNPCLIFFSQVKEENLKAIKELSSGLRAGSSFTDIKNAFDLKTRHEIFQEKS